MKSTGGLRQPCWPLVPSSVVNTAQFLFKRSQTVKRRRTLSVLLPCCLLILSSAGFWDDAGKMKLTFLSSCAVIPILLLLFHCVAETS